MKATAPILAPDPKANSSDLGRSFARDLAELVLLVVQRDDPGHLVE
jgi:hypothetical protein